MNQDVELILAKQDADIVADELALLTSYFIDHHDDVQAQEWTKGILEYRYRWGIHCTLRILLINWSDVRWKAFNKISNPLVLPLQVKLA